jgi:hypothetical protein
MNTSTAEPNADRDGTVVYKGDRVEQIEAATGKTIRKGRVTTDPVDGRVMVRWGSAAYDIVARCAEICVVPG